MSDELRASAMRIAMWSECTSYQVVSLDTVHAVAKLAEAYLAEHPADDDEPAMPEWLESLGYADTLGMRYERRFEMCNGIRIVCFASEHPKRWASEIWVGNGACYAKQDPTRRDVRRLLAALGIEVTK